MLRPAWKTGDVASAGVVRDFHPDEGWGVIDGAAVPGGCWVHCSAIVMDGCRQLNPGQRVLFRAEAADQDGFRFRATAVWLDGAEPAGLPADAATGTAYRSCLTLTFERPGDPGEH